MIIKKIAILFIEDSELTNMVWQQYCQKFNLSCFFATTAAEAEEVFKQHKDEIDIIFMDGCLNSSKINTLELTATLHKIFAGKIIASSSNEKSNTELEKKGCNCTVIKENVTAKLKTIGNCLQCQNKKCSD